MKLCIALFIGLKQFHSAEGCYSFPIINENEADYVLKRKVNNMKKAEKHHEQRLQEYKEQNIRFATEEEEVFIRLFYTQQELEDIFAGYDLGVKRLHLQNLYMERMRQLFDLYNLKGTNFVGVS
ncbi:MULTISPECIES: hypothetical protein [Bacillus amyloliquefaciens group]|uniref:hypothetical protein n=1 Tax=Bacillus amyloliquefaciens group TaxID=1938374 RepID=UPI003980D4E5